MTDLEVKLIEELTEIFRNRKVHRVNCARITKELSEGTNYYLKIRMCDNVNKLIGVGPVSRMVTAFGYHVGLIGVPKGVEESDPRLQSAGAHADVYAAMCRALTEAERTMKVDHYLDGPKRSLDRLMRSKGWPDLIEFYRCVLQGRLLRSLESL